MGYQSPYGYPQFYQPPMPDQLAQLRQQPYQPAMQQTSPQGQQSIVWVNGEMEAMSYWVAPNSAVALWDSNAPVIYFKQADASGKPSIKIYDLVERNAANKQNTDYATRDELNALAARLSALEKPKGDINDGKSNV